MSFSKKIKISEVTTFENVTFRPILVQFQQKFPLTHENDEEFVWHKSADKDSNMLIAENSTTGNKYHGIIGENYSDLVDTYVGIVDKNTKKMRLVQVEQCLLRNTYNDEPALESKSEIDYKKVIGKEFGSKKSIRFQERKDRMKINLEMVQNTLDESINMEKENSFDDKFEKSRTLREASMLLIAPTMNAEASDDGNIYTIESVLGKELLDLLDADAIAVLKSNPETLPLQDNILLSTIISIQKSKKPDTPENLDKTKAIMYLDALANLINSRKNRAHRSSIFTDMSEEINRHIRENYSPPHLFLNLNSQFTQHKAVCYFIVLSLLISGKMRIHIDEITKIINFTKTNLMKYVKRIGGYINLNTNVVQLKKPGADNKEKEMNKKKKLEE